MQFHFVETKDPFSLRRTGHVLDSDIESDEAVDLLMALRAQHRLQFHYLLADVTCDELGDIFAEFREGHEVVGCTLAFLDRIKRLMIQEGYSIAENKRDWSKQMMMLLFEKNELPVLRMKMCRAAGPQAVIEFTREELSALLHYCLRAGMQDALWQITTEDLSLN